jgi:hypothetical protein
MTAKFGPHFNSRFPAESLPRSLMISLPDAHARRHPMKDGPGSPPCRAASDGQGG